MMTMKEKFLQVRSLLQNAQASLELREAEHKINLAMRLMSEIESSMLRNPYLQDQDLAWVVQFNRGPIWNAAHQHLKSLRKPS